MQRKQRKLTIARLLVVVFLVILIGLIGWLGYIYPEIQENTKRQASPSKRQECPKAWIYDAMPGIEDDSNRPPREYFIYGDTRVEVNDVDIEWVKANCTVNKASLVH